MKKISIACMVAVADTAVFGENEGSELIDTVELIQ